MDLGGTTIVLALGDDDGGPDAGALINQVAEECCRSESSTNGDEDSFVMITTEHRRDGVVKRVAFDRADAAERFKALILLVEPRARFGA